MEAVFLPEMSLFTYKDTWYHNPDHILMFGPEAGSSTFLRNVNPEDQNLKFNREVGIRILPETSVSTYKASLYHKPVHRNMNYIFTYHKTCT
jgi:hypothetical protein